MEEQNNGSTGLYVNGIEYKIAWERAWNEYSLKVESYEIKYKGRDYFTKIDKLPIFKAKNVAEGIDMIAQEIIWNSWKYE